MILKLSITLSLTLMLSGCCILGAGPSYCKHNTRNLERQNQIMLERCNYAHSEYLVALAAEDRDAVKKWQKVLDANCAHQHQSDGI